jgi:hypothetical protein
VEKQSFAMQASVIKMLENNGRTKSAFWQSKKSPSPGLPDGLFSNQKSLVG